MSECYMQQLNIRYFKYLNEYVLNISTENRVYKVKGLKFKVFKLLLAYSDGLRRVKVISV